MRVRVDPPQADRIEFMQGFEFGIRVPPTMCKVAEFLQFVGIGVGHGGSCLDESVERALEDKP
jgi:hypothetical protein